MRNNVICEISQIEVPSTDQGFPEEKKKIEQSDFEKCAVGVVNQ